MPAWLPNPFRNRWTRVTRWTPLLLNQRELQRALSKERSRVDRNGGQFGLIILRLDSLVRARPQSIRLARVLKRRLRDTDEIGHLGLGRIGVMLPETGQLETDGLLTELLTLLRNRRIAVSGEAFVYPDKGSDVPHQGGRGNELEKEEADRAKQASFLAMTVPEFPKWKRVLDIVGASLGLLLSALFVVLMAVVIRLTSPGPVFFAQRRTGYLGQTFEIYKLRTMVTGAEAMQVALRAKNERDGPAFKMQGDPRITRIGRVLRATGLDELPQFYNVLRGDMSLVGPRPLPVFEANQCTPWQRRRQEVKPGLTCFWQLSKFRDVSFQQWMRLDLQYARRYNLRMDLSLMARTVLSVVLGRVGH